MRFDRAGVSIVIEEGLKNRESEGAGLTYKLKGYDIKHMLVEGEDGSVVDMMSTAPEDKLPPVMLTLSENGEISGRSCSFQENPRTPAVLSFGYLKQDKFEFSWDIGDIAELFLHETGHHLIIANNRRIGRDNIQAERDTNALAILRSRDINKKLARKFFDVEKVRSWIQGQLKRGYDEEELTGKKYPASTKQRNEMFKERRLNNLARVRESLKKIVDEPDSRN